MIPYQIISKKRDGKCLTPQEIHSFISSFVKGEIADYQMSALLMAIYFQSLNYDETIALTEAYIESGIKLNLAEISGIKIDKHSTGGVGDKVSIVLAPMVASLGITVPMISGRGLGHTGGTLDKLESIPGFKTDISISQFKTLLKEFGIAIIGQSRKLVPADKQIYALRDVTATIDSIPLISASIMSKKIAEGIDGLVMDVKYGNGAFMKEIHRARSLAKTLIKIGKHFGKKVTALLTAMEQPLGYKIGNWLEITECLECLQGKEITDLREIVLALGSHMLIMGEQAQTKKEALKKCQAVLDNGSAYEKFLQFASAQGADTTYLEKIQHYPVAKEKGILRAKQNGYLTKINTWEVGMTSVMLGAGRLRSSDKIDPQSGIIIYKKLGDQVSVNEPLLELHTNSSAIILSVALEKLQNAFLITEQPVKPVPIVLEQVYG